MVLISYGGTNQPTILPTSSSFNALRVVRQDWRVSYGMDTILDEDLSGLGLDREFYWSGFDREGRPCLVFRACEHRRSETSNDVTPELKVPTQTVLRARDIYLTCHFGSRDLGC